MGEILMILATVFSTVALYLAVTALHTFRHRTSYPHAAPQSRFAVIIPARNEAHILPNIIQCLREQDYPAELMDIIVAANNCTDNTADTARSLGVRVIECTPPITCKGDVLHQVIDRLMQENYDAFAFFDADNLPDPHFLQAMNDAFCAGEKLCKGRLKAGNAYESWVAGGYGLYHALMEWTFSRPHALAGCSSNLVGTGFAVHRSAFEQLHGWNTVSMCEDSEFDAICAANGIRCAWVEEALSYDEQVTTFGTSMRQRLRWCSGMIQAARVELPHLLSRKCPNRKLALDFAMLLIIAHTQPIATALMVLALPFLPVKMLLASGISLVLSYIGVALASILMCVLGGYSIRKMWGAILMSPIFMASWAPLQVAALVTPVKNWSAIRHNGQPSAKEVG